MSEIPISSADTGVVIVDQTIARESAQSIIEDFAEKEAIVKQFVSEKRGSRSNFGLFSDQEHGAEYFQERIARQNKETGVLKWLQRLRFRNSLKAAGVQDPQQLVSFLDNNVDIYSYGDIPARGLANLLKTLDPDDEHSALERFNRGLQRLQQLNLFPHSYDFKSGNLSQAVVSLVDVPDSVFQQVYSELDQCKFLHHYRVISSPSTQVMVEIFEHGGLTKKQQDLLEREELYSVVTGTIPLVSEDNANRRFDSLPNLAQALNPKEQYLEEFYPYLIDYASLRIQHPIQFQHLIGERIFYRFIDGLEFLRESNRLPIFQRLLQNGWSGTDIYTGLEGGYGAPSREKVVETLDKISDFIQDQEKVTWVRQFQESLEGISKLLPTRVDEYEAIYRQKDKLEQLRVFVQMLPKTAESRVYGGVMSISEDGDIKINYQVLSERLKDFVNNPDIPDEEKSYAYLITTILNNMPGIKKGGYYTSEHPLIEGIYIPLLAYTALHRDQLGEVITGDKRLNATLVAGILDSKVLQNDEMISVLIKLCKDPENLPPHLAWQHLSVFNIGQIHNILANLPDNFVNGLPLTDQQVIYFVKSLEGLMPRPQFTQAFLLVNKDQVAQLLVDGKPTASLFDLLASRNVIDEAIDVLLTEDVMSSFSLDERQFWQEFKSLEYLESRKLLFDNKDRFREYIVDGKPTAKFLNEFTVGRDLQQINGFLALADIESFPAAEREFWTFYKAHPKMQHFLLGVRENFSTMFVDGKPTINFLDQAAATHNPHFLVIELFQSIDWDLYPQQKPFWEYYVKSSPQLKAFVYKHKDRFAEFVVDGRESLTFYQTLADEDPRLFVQYAQREQWRAAFGDELINKFLNVLPKQTDEKRNAFTHNEYDRTTNFLDYLLTNSGEFQLNEADLVILTDYIQQFGLSKTPVLFHFFKNLSLFEQQKIDQLPKDIEQSGVKSIQEMIDQLRKIQTMVFSEEPITDLINLSPFEVEMLRFITGKSTHRWDSGKPSIEVIIGDFQKDLADGSVASLPEGYHTETVSTSNVRIEFNEEAIREDYETLKNEILVSIQNPGDVEGLKGIVQDVLQRKIAEVQRAANESEGKKLEFMSREITRFEEYIARLSSIDNLDSLMGGLLDMNFDKTEQRVINSVFRRIIFGKVFQKHFSPGFIQEIQRQLEGDMSAASIESILNVVDEMAKTHALNLEGNNNEGYWDNELFLKIKGSKRGRGLPNSFSPHAGKLREEVGKFQKIQTGGINEVRVIPDRGFVGEMSGYLADVCYTAEYPLLKSFPNVVPYKFVSINPETNEPQFIGSVLVFEVNDAAGNASMLVRAFDVPHEDQIDVNSFIEQYLDKLAAVGQQRGIKQILVPGITGAMSNYQMTINHMRQNYTVGKTPISLAEKFAFNGYDLTSNCYVARTIE